MTVSSRARIPVAIFNSFRTATCKAPHIRKLLRSGPDLLRSQIAGALKLHAHANGWKSGKNGPPRVVVVVFLFFVSVSPGVPRVILNTLMMRMMVGLMGNEAFRSISSSVIPMMDSSTMARSNWFHLGNKNPVSFCSSIVTRFDVFSKMHHFS